MARPVASCVLLMKLEEANAKQNRDGDGASPDSTPALAETGGDCCAEGAEAAPPPSASGNALAIEVEERKTLELWFDMLGICLLPFCSGSGSGGGRTSGTSTPAQPDAAAAAAAAGAEQANDGDPFDSDSDDEDEEDDENDGDDGGGGAGGGKTRSGWVAGWMRRAGVALAEPLECPFEIRSGGRDEDLPCRLAALAASHAQV